MVNISNRDLWYALGLSAIFLSGFVGTSLVHHYIIRPMRKRQHLRERMSETRRDDLVRAKIFKTEPAGQKGANRYPYGTDRLARHVRKTAKELMRAGIYKTPGNFLSLAVILASAGFILGRFVEQLPGKRINCPDRGGHPLSVLSIKKKQRTSLIERQMPDVMELLARSLRAGHTLPSAMELAGKETPEPLGTELRTAYEEQRLGLSLSEALRHMVDRVASRDLRYFVTAVLIQTETGGNLAEIMEKIGFLIRDRLRVKGKIRGLTAEGRLSAFILGILPFAMFVILYAIHKKYVMTLFVDPWGKSYWWRD